jgi:transcriptional regulator with XRE-family HTH domain
VNTTARHVRGDDEDVTPGAVARLAEALTALRRDSGLTMDQFAATVGLSKPRLMMAETGNLVPDHDVIYAYLELPRLLPTQRHRLRSLWGQAQRVRRGTAAAGLDPVLAQLDTYQPRQVLMRDDDDLHQDVDLTLTKPSWRRSVTKSQANPKLWPDPAKITNVEEFTTALSTIKSSTGLSYEALAAASQRASYPLARSTVHALCTKPRLPSSPKAVACFIDICGGRRADVEAWTSTWQRLAQQRAVDANPVGSEDLAVDQDPEEVTTLVREPTESDDPDGVCDTPLLRLEPLLAQTETTAESHPPETDEKERNATRVNLALILGTAVMLFVAGMIAGAVILP